MPINGFTVGRDHTITIVTPQSAIAPTLITKFSAKRDETDKKVKGMDGITRNVVFPDGWSGTIESDRQDSTWDDYFAGVEADYYSGVDSGKCTITETIQETSGAVTQWQYTNVVFKYDNAGDYAGDDTVHQRVSFMAERRIKLT